MYTSTEKAAYINVGWLHDYPQAEFTLIVTKEQNTCAVVALPNYTCSRSQNHHYKVSGLNKEIL